MYNCSVRSFGDKGIECTFQINRLESVRSRHWVDTFAVMRHTIRLIHVHVPHTPSLDVSPLPSRRRNSPFLPPL